MDLWDSLIRMVAALAVVLGVLLLGWGVARRVLGRIGAADPEGPLVQVLGTGSLGPRREVFVVAVAGEVLVLGATATSLVPLGRIRDPERVARLLAQRARPRPAAGSGAGLAAVAAWSGAGAGRRPRRRRGTSVSQDAAGTSKLVRQCTRGARLAVAAVAVVTGVGAGSAWAGGPSLTLDLGGGPGATATVIQLLALLTVLSLAPAFFIMVTAFTRIVIVLAFLRQAIGAPQVPPNQVLISLALFLTFFVMAPVWDRVSETALQPFLAEQITHEEALARGLVPIREFMLRQVREKDLELFVELARRPKPAQADELPTHVIIPAFILSELRIAFQIGFLLYIPFLIVDMVVASVLMSMGMMLLPPVVISLPFKLILFVLADGWYLVVGSMLRSFH
ncbi:flagellar type III secretion system pore protein FliP [Nitrospira sp. Kam-Ns4a]